MLKIIIIIFSFFCIPIFSFAETIYLKSGKTVEGKILERNDKYIKIDFYGVSLVYYLDEIKQIDNEVINESKESGNLAKKPSNLDEQFLNRITNLIADSNDPLELHGAAALCFGLVLSKGLLEASDTIILKASPDFKEGFQFILANTPELVNNAVKAWQKAVDLAKENSKYHLVLALVLRLKGQKEDLDWATKELQKTIELERNNGLPYYILSLVFYQKKALRDTWLNVRSGLEKPINIDPISFYEAIENILRYLGYDQPFVGEYAGIATKAIYTHIIFNIGYSVHVLVKEIIEAKAFAADKGKANQQLEYCKALINVGDQLINLKPQSFFAESLGLTHKSAAYALMTVFYKNRGDRETLNKIKQELYDLQNLGVDINSRANIVFSALDPDKIHDANKLIKFVRDSFIIGEERSGIQNLGIK